MTQPEQSSRPVLLTGATGLLGSHIAERLCRGGAAVRALCRPGADVSLLNTLGVRIIEGDLSGLKTLRRACEGVETVYHGAARVGDWGCWADFARVTVDGTRNLVEAAVEAGVSRFLHISSISVYGQVNGEGITLDESAPLGVNLPRTSYYSRAKIQAEEIVWDAHARGRLVVTVLRPSWLYGPRDRATLPRLVDSIRRRKLKLIGDGENRVNVVHAGNAADAAILAAQGERAAGEIYNCSHDGNLTQRRYFNLIARAIGEPDIKARVPYRVARSAAFVLETAARLLRAKRPPFVTKYAVWLMGRRCFFECEKIKKQLGWASKIGYEEGIPAAVEDALTRAASG